MAVGGRAALVLAVVGGAVLPPLCRYAAVVLQEQPQPPPRPAPQPPFRTPPPQHPPRALQPQPAAGGPRPPRQTPRPGPPELWGLLTERWEAAERPPLNCSSYHQAWGLLDATCHPPIRPCASSAAPDLRALAAWLPGRTLFLVGDSHIRWLFGQLWCMADAAGVVAAMTRWQPWHGQEYIVFRRSGQRGAAPDGAPLARSVYTWDWNARNRPRLPLTCLELTPDGGGDGSWAQPPPWHAKGPGPALPGAGRVCLRALYKSSRREVGRQYDHPADFLANVPLQGSDAVVIGIGTHYRAGDKLWVHEGDLRADARRATKQLATGPGLGRPAPLAPPVPPHHRRAGPHPRQGRAARAGRLPPAPGALDLAERGAGRGVRAPPRRLARTAAHREPGRGPRHDVAAQLRVRGGRVVRQRLCAFLSGRVLGGAGGGAAGGGLQRVRPARRPTRAL
eukprot:TRINITY_DN30679_c0_g1_i1.p1 TRINITY_DN30679_c0_g1~~TRINITY_DN30679_c0_g1_i1.p1  ORF type:complete len:476 (+),score=54.00 TRINITY_DN30679_c0_g1_i1:81-1430(+)